jgi:molybdopterin synthase sulfur carrier subunit
VKLLYFAWVRTKTGTGEETVSPPDSVHDVAGLIEWLKLRSSGGADAFSDPSLIRVAVNQDYVEFDHPVIASDEIAFFPPVTGG